MGIKYAVNEKFFDVWSPRMAYTLGYIFADGCLQELPEFRQKYISVTSTDPETIERLKNWMS